MIPTLKRLSAIAIYTPDLPVSEELYRLLGLRSDALTTSTEATGQVVLNFSEGDAQLVLHSDRDRQFVELYVSVDDVRDIYERLARDPSYAWLETPHRVADLWRVVVRLPDDNVFTLLSPERVERRGARTEPDTTARA